MLCCPLFCGVNCLVVLSGLLERMELSDCIEEQHSAPDPPQTSTVSSGTKDSPQISSHASGKGLTVAEGNSSANGEVNGEAEQDSAEMDSVQSDGADRAELRLDLDHSQDQDGVVGQDGQGGGNTSCDSGTASLDDARTPTAHHNGLVESLPVILDDTVTVVSNNFKEPKESSVSVQEELPANRVTECPPSDLDDTSSVKLNTLEGTSKPPDSVSQPGTVTGSASLPQTKETVHLHTAPSFNLYDTDCSRKLMSEIQRSISQESLLEELESELLNYQLQEQGSSRASPPNGLPKDQVFFEKCVQYKYSQQEKAIKR